eukprot:gene51813-27678_t
MCFAKRPWRTGGAGYHAVAAAEEALRALPPVRASAFAFCAACNVKLLRARRAKAPQPAAPSTSATTSCSFCMCDETPLVRIGDCGERVCVPCLQRWIEIDVGARRLVRDRASGRWTVACPTHAASLLVDTPLLKLAPPETYARYHRFS